MKVFGIIFALASLASWPVLADQLEALEKAAADDIEKIASCSAEALKANADLHSDLEKATIWCGSQQMTVQRPERSPFDDSIKVLTTLVGTTLDGSADGDTILGFACREHETTVALIFATSSRNLQSRVQYRLGKDALVNETWVVTEHSVYLRGPQAMRFIQKISSRPDDDLLVRVFDQTTEERRFKLVGTDKAADFVGSACGWK